MTNTPTAPLLREIKAEAVRSGMTFAKLAQATDMTYGQLSRRLAGTTPITLAEFIAACDALDTRPSVLFDRAAA